MFEKSKDLTGKKFGKLTPLRRDGKSGRSVTWLCLCECGNEKIVRGSNLTAKIKPVSSCGCALGYEDLTGRRFGCWSVLERRGNDASRSARWLCRCDCGEETLVSSDALRHGKSGSCGCVVRTQSGDSGSPEYAAWNAAIHRCHNPQTGNYADYGGRGISVCDAWRESYAAFLSHIGRRPSSRHSLDRIDNDGHYEPGNVRWATKKQQLGNRRNSRR